MSGAVIPLSRCAACAGYARKIARLRLARSVTLLAQVRAEQQRHRASHNEPAGGES